MHLYLVRHGIAVERDSVDLFGDTARELTPDGILKLRVHAKALRNLKVQLDEVWTSPLVRARQTAEILAEYFDPPPPVKIVKALEPAGHFEAVLQALQESAVVESVALVGHEPFLGEFASFLMGGPRNLSIPIKKGGVAHLRIDDFHPPLRGELRWLLTPKQLARME